jgi:trehalose 6-phosphate phosphatase
VSDATPGQALPEVFSPFLVDPTSVGVFTDFDGTLAPIVDVPDQAVPLDGVVAALEDLAGRVARVAVISGRPVAFLQRFFTDSPVVLSGLYGLESVVDGELVIAPGAGAWREAVEDVVAAASGAPEGMTAENKGLSVTLHFRGRPEIADAVAQWAEGQAARSGLEVRSARMSVELHPPVGTDKGDVLEGLADGLGSVCFLGDDVGDIPAFAALDRMRAEGRSVAKVVVDSNEIDPDVAAAADVTVDGPAQALALLHSLTAALPPR